MIPPTEALLIAHLVDSNERKRAVYKSSDIVRGVLSRIDTKREIETLDILC